MRSLVLEPLVRELDSQKFEIRSFAHAQLDCISSPTLVPCSQKSGRTATVLARIFLSDLHRSSPLPVFSVAMAEAPDLPKTLEDMEKEISCSVCLGHYREPKILPCFHYYCTECLQRLAARVGQPVPCPECRKETAFPQNDARQLPTPFFVNRMIDLYSKLEKAEGKKEAICELCALAGKPRPFAASVPSSFVVSAPNPIEE